MSAPQVIVTGWTGAGYGVERELEESISHHYRRYQDMGYLTEDDTPTPA